MQPYPAKPQFDLSPLLARVRREYREMPGLRLTFEQARRLWEMDAHTCALVLTMLIAEGFLLLRHGTYTVVGSPRLQRTA